MKSNQLNPHIAARLKEKAEKIRGQHSTFWMGSDIDELAREVDAGSIDYIDRLRKAQRGIGNLVKIVTGKEIPVVYSSGEQSYTDGKTVVISANVDPTGLDAMCGTALHEATHVAESVESLKFLPVMHRDFELMISNTDLPNLAKKLNIPLRPVTGAQSGASDPAMTQAPGHSALEHVQMVMNVLEDRRIDLWQYKNAPGYRPYYDAMYDEYWHSPKIDAALVSPMYRELSIENYILFVINMTNSKWSDAALPGLREIRKIANLNESGLFARGDSDPRWKSYPTSMRRVPVVLDDLPGLFADSVRIVEIMYKNATSVQSSNKSKQDEKNCKGNETGDGPSGDLPNMDMGPSRKEVAKAIERQRRFLNHEIEKEKIDAQSNNEMRQMDLTNASIKDVEGDFLPRGAKARVIVYRDCTKAAVTNDSFPFKYHYDRYSRNNTGGRNPEMVNALTNGIRLGQVLAHRLRIMSDEKPLTFNRQEHGRLDKRRVAALGHGAEDVFSFTVTEKLKPANLWIDVDFSGSMHGEKAANAMTLAVAVAFAAQKTRTLNVTIAVRDSGTNCARVAILYDSRRHSFNRLREIVPHITPSGGTPESLAFEAIKDEILKSYGNERKYFINLSDGEPGTGFMYQGKSYSYGGEAAYKHCRQLMNEFRTSGIEVMSYYIGDSYSGQVQEHPAFKSMYGQDARFIDPKSITAIANTINKMLLK